MDQQQLNNIIGDIEEMDMLFMLMANAALVFEDLEDGEAGLPDTYWYQVSIDMDDFLTMGDPSFKLHFCMTRTTFEALVQIVGQHLVLMNRLERERTPLAYILMMVIWLMATPDSFRSVALQFGVKPGAVHWHYRRIIIALRELAPRYKIWPNAEEHVTIKKAFEAATGFPGVIGCIDGTHHYIIAPQIDPVRYLNRHHSYSLNTQCVCDHQLLIRDMYVGEAGSMHDSRVFRRSPLCRSLLEDENIIGIDEHILGDGGYILTDSVLIPFRNNGHLSNRERNYNSIHSRSRSRIEQCFGHMKMMWRRSMHLHTMHPETVVDHLLATAMLHNFVLLNGEEVLPDEEQAAPLNADEEVGEDADVVDLNDEDFDYPNVAGEPDHHLLADARERGIEKRLHVVRNLPVLAFG